MIRPVCKERRKRMTVRYRVNYKLLHGMGLLLCSFLLCACSAPAPADTTEFAPAVPTATQVEQKQEEPAKALSEATAADLEQTPIETPAPIPAASASSEQTEVAPEGIAPVIVPEKPEPTLQPTVAETPLPTPEDTPAEEAADELLTLQSVVEIGAVMRVQIPRALVKEGISPTAEYVVNITYNSKELLSCVVEVIGADGGTANALVPVTLDLKTRSSCKLSDFFSKEDTGWKGLIPDIVTDMAKQKNLTLLCEVPPVGDDQPFYIEGGSIVLLYRPYEITTYEAGAPTFVLPEEELAPYLSGAYGIGE